MVERRKSALKREIRMVEEFQLSINNLSIINSAGQRNGKKNTFGESAPGFSLAIKEWTGTAPGFPSGVTKVYFWLLS